MPGTLSSSLGLWFLLFISNAIGACYDASPAFPPPVYHKSDPVLRDAFDTIQTELDSIISNHAFNTTSFSIEVTSSKKTLWSSFHTARDRDATRPGADKVNGESMYRIASITKTFTTLGILQQHAKGTLHLDDPVDKYIEDFKSPKSGSLPWKDITLRSLASQLSGLPRDWAQGDLLSELDDPTKYGLPPPNNTHLPDCYSYGKLQKPCTISDMLPQLRRSKPVFAPNAQSSYSNLAFEVLGLVLANVTGMKYEQYITKSILKPIGMDSASFKTPPDSVAVLPKNLSWFWDVDEGVHNPTGGLYSSSSSLSLYLRYILTHYNGLHTGSNWLQPASFASGTNSFYGMPWEIFRTSSPFLLPHTSRPVTFYTKGGGLPGYTTNIMLVPEYDLGITVLVAGNGGALDLIREVVTGQVVRAADRMSAAQVKHKYAGTFKSEDRTLNSSLTLKYAAKTGLTIESWISNGTEFLATLVELFPGAVESSSMLQLVPTLLYVDETNQRGERWRVLVVPARKERPGVWDDFCLTDVDYLLYDGRPLNEIIFWDDDGKQNDGKGAKTAELTAFRVRLDRMDGVKDHKPDNLEFVIQEL